MKKFTSFSVILLLILCLSSIDRASANLPERISKVPKSSKNVQRIYLRSGLASVFILPCPLEEVILGKKEHFKLSISDQNSKILNLSVLNSFTTSTNLITRCVNSEKFLVFDLIPHNSIHQDVVIVKRNRFLKLGSKELINSSENISQIKKKAIRVSIKGPKRGEK